jgi:hypothetical protein
LRILLVFIIWNNPRIFSMIRRYEINKSIDKNNTHKIIVDQVTIYQKIYSKEYFYIALAVKY